MEPSDQPAAHRRSQSDVAGFLDVAAGMLQDASQAPGHVRSVSLGSSASQFLQSLKLQDPAALQHSLQGPADQFALPDQHTPHAACAGADASTAAAQDRGAGQPARSKRTHRSSNGRASKDAMQLDSMGLEQQSHGFTPLPAVVENSPLDSERDWDSDSDREGYGPNRRGSRGAGRRGGCNGRSESELMLLDPKRVKRILANRESAARSKERRMNYTAELEGKLQVLGVEADKLNSQLNSLSKQEGKLRASKADLEQQVVSMQQQLQQVVSDNQALMGKLFQLHAALGLPEALPDGITSACMTDSAQYQQSWQAYQQQYADSAQPISPKQRKPRRQSKQQDKQRQQQQAGCEAWAGASYAGGGVEPDLNDPAAAAAAPVAELPVRPVSKTQAAATAGTATPAAAAAGCPAVAQAGSSVGHFVPHNVVTTGPPSSGPGSNAPPPLQISPRQHQWHTGLGSSTSTTPAATPHPYANGAAVQLPNTAGGGGAAGFSRPAASGQAGLSRPPAAGVAGGSTAPSVAASAAGDAAAMLLLGQLPSPGADAVMGDAEDDIAMLGAFLDDESAMDSAAGGDGAGSGAAATAPGGVQTQQQGLPHAAAVDHAEAAAAPASASALAAGWANLIAGNTNHQSAQAAAAAAAGPAARAAAAAPVNTWPHRISPALSDPAGLEMWGRDDVSSGSVGGCSFTHSHTPNLTPSGRQAAEGVSGVQPAYVGAGSWQQQQQQYGSRTLGVSPPVGPAGAAAARSPLAVQPLATTQISPLTPVSGRVRTPSGSGAAAAAAAGAGAGVGAAGGMSVYALDPMQANPAHQQQQQQAGMNFAMGANPAASWSRGRHVRSVSTGCVDFQGWQGCEQFALQNSSEALMQQQQQQQQSGIIQQTSSVLAAHQQTMQTSSSALAPAAAPISRGVVTTATGFPPIQGHLSLPSMPEVALPGQASLVGPGSSLGGPDMSHASWQRHRRSHSHAAAFMGQFELSAVQQQQQQQQAYTSMPMQHGQAGHNNAL